MDSTNSSSSSLGSTLTIREMLCAVFIPLVALVEPLICKLVACFDHHPRPPENLNYSFDDIVCLVNDSPFTVNEIEALRTVQKIE